MKALYWKKRVAHWEGYIHGIMQFRITVSRKFYSNGKDWRLQYHLHDGGVEDPTGPFDTVHDAKAAAIASDSDN